MLLVAVRYPREPLYCIAERGEFCPDFPVERCPLPWYCFGGLVWPFAASRAVFLDHPASRLPGSPSVCPYILRVNLLPMGRLCQQDGEVGFLGMGIVQLGGRAYILA